MSKLYAVFTGIGPSAVPREPLEAALRARLGTTYGKKSDFAYVAIPVSSAISRGLLEEWDAPRDIYTELAVELGRLDGQPIARGDMEAARAALDPDAIAEAMGSRYRLGAVSFSVDPAYSRLPLAQISSGLPAWAWLALLGIPVVYALSKKGR